MKRPRHVRLTLLGWGTWMLLLGVLSSQAQIPTQIPATQNQFTLNDSDLKKLAPGTPGIAYLQNEEVALMVPKVSALKIEGMALDRTPLQIIEETLDDGQKKFWTYLSGVYTGDHTSIALLKWAVPGTREGTRFSLPVELHSASTTLKIFSASDAGAIKESSIMIVWPGLGKRLAKPTGAPPETPSWASAAPPVGFEEIHLTAGASSSPQASGATEQKRKFGLYLQGSVGVLGNQYSGGKTSSSLGGRAGAGIYFRSLEGSVFYRRGFLSRAGEVQATPQWLQASGGYSWVVNPVREIRPSLTALVGFDYYTNDTVTTETLSHLSQITNVSVGMKARFNYRYRWDLGGTFLAGVLFSQTRHFYLQGDLSYWQNPHLRYGAGYWMDVYQHRGVRSLDESAGALELMAALYF